MIYSEESVTIARVIVLLKFVYTLAENWFVNNK